MGSLASLAVLCPWFTWAALGTSGEKLELMTGTANDGCYKAAVSGDGSVVAYWTRSTSLVANDLDQDADIFVTVRGIGTEVVSVDSFGQLGDSTSVDPSISADGR